MSNAYRSLTTLLSILGLVTACAGDDLETFSKAKDGDDKDTASGDGDADGDTDTDTDVDTDGDADGDGDANPWGDLDIDGDADGDGDTSSTPYSCPVTIPDSDLSDGVGPSCALESADHINCSYDSDVVCICGGAGDKPDMVWQCITCPESASQGATCDVTDLVCDYGVDTCVCERIDSTDRAWNCGGGTPVDTDSGGDADTDGDGDADTDTDTDVDTEPDTPYTCPEAEPSADLSVIIGPSCADEPSDHINCSYAGGVVCICGGASEKPDMVWQCITCSEAEPTAGTVCEVTDLVCEYGGESIPEMDAGVDASVADPVPSSSCICERIGSDREWSCQ